MIAIIVFLIATGGLFIGGKQKDTNYPEETTRSKPKEFTNEIRLT